MYSPQLLDHFEHPRNAGEIAEADASVRVENPACGDVLELTLQIEESRISEIRFRAKGCVPAMACGSAVTELAKGKSIAELRAVRAIDVVDAVGGLPQASSHASRLAIDALKAVIDQIGKAHSGSGR